MVGIGDPKIPIIGKSIKEMIGEIFNQLTCIVFVFLISDEKVKSENTNKKVLLVLEKPSVVTDDESYLFFTRNSK